MGKNPLDLTSPPPDAVIRNQSPGTGESFFAEVDGLVHEYHHDDDLFIIERIANKMRSEAGWFEKITKHGPSIGDFYESLVKTAIQELLPGRLCLGTGFIFDSMRRLASSQIDFIVYSDEEHAPLYRRGDFVVVDCNQVISCAEIKKTLTTSNLKSVINKTIHLNLGSSELAAYGVQHLNIFAFSGNMSSKRAQKTIVSEVRKYLSKFHSRVEAGHGVKLGVMQLVLPQIFFFDRSEYIMTTCKITSNGFCDIISDICDSSVEGHNLGEFISYLLYPNKTSPGFHRRDFLSFPIRSYESEVLIEDSVAIFRRLSMSEIVSLFPGEINKLQGVKINGRRPYAALIPAGIDTRQMRSLDDLLSVEKLHWLTIDEKDK